MFVLVFLDQNVQIFIHLIRIKLLSFFFIFFLQKLLDKYKGDFFYLTFFRILKWKQRWISTTLFYEIVISIFCWVDNHLGKAKPLYIKLAMKKNLYCNAIASMVQLIFFFFFCRTLCSFIRIRLQTRKKQHGSLWPRRLPVEKKCHSFHGDNRWATLNVFATCDSCEEWCVLFMYALCTNLLQQIFDANVRI